MFFHFPQKLIHMDRFCPTDFVNLTGMNKPTPPKRKLVQLELALEARAENWDVKKRRAMAAIYLRWSHQLNVSANVIEAHLPRVDAPPKLIPMHPRKQALN